jgi:chitodextrinase
MAGFSYYYGAPTPAPPYDANLDASVNAIVGNSSSATVGTLRAAYVPKWAANTAYASGEPVLNPSGQTVTANAAFTSGATYDSSKWTSPTGGGGPSNLAVVDTLPASPVTGTVYILTGDKTAPTAPTGLTATPGDTTVGLSWSAAADNVAVANYRVYRGGVLAASPPGTSYTDFGLTDGTQYSYTVSAVDAAGNESARSTAVTATPTGGTPDTTAPTVPGTPTATAGNAQATVSFTAATDNVAVTGYRVYYSADGYATAVATGSASPITVTSLTNGTAYTFEVAAYDAAGNQSAKTAASNSVTPTVSTTVPGAPTGLIATAGNGQAALSWTAPASNGGASITDYVVQYRTTAGPGAWQTFADGTSTATTATVTGLTNGTGYDFQVAAVNSVGTGTYSSTASATPAGAATTLDSTAFTQADGAGLPVTDQGRTWTAFGVAGTAATFGVKSNQACVYTTSAANPTGSVIDVATADVSVQGTITTIGATSPGIGLIVGYADSSNFIYTTQTSISKYVSGTFTSLGTFTTAFVSGDVMKLSRSGSTVNVYKNGALLKTVTVADAAILAATKHGIAFRGNDNLSRLDDWSVTAP